jgi:hypothetical protein
MAPTSTIKRIETVDKVKFKSPFRALSSSQSWIAQAILNRHS